MHHNRFRLFSAIKAAAAAALLGSSAIATAADVAITKQDNPDPVNTNSELTYTINVSNSGPEEATGVSWSDTLPSGTTFVSFDQADANVGWTCQEPEVGQAGTVTCSTATLSAEGSGQFILVVRVGSAVPEDSTLRNTADVTSTSVDTDESNNSATAETTVLSPADVTGNKGVIGDTTPGSTITYTIVLANKSASGQQDNPGNEFTDTLPDTLTLVDAEASAGTVVADTATNTVTWSGSVPAKDSVTVTITATINSGTEEQTISNTGTIYYDLGGTGTNDGTASTTTAAFVVTSGAPNRGDLGITKVSETQTTRSDRDVSYTIQVTNGGSNADNASWSDTLPGNMTFVGFAQESGPLWSCNTPAVGAGGTITCTLASVPPNTTSVFTLVGHIPPGVAEGTEYTNIASVTSSNDPNSENNSAGYAVIVAGTTTTVSSSLNPSIYGQAVTFTATVTSDEGTPAGSVQFTIDGTDVGSPVPLDANGNATLTTSALTGGTHTVTATYMAVDRISTSGSVPGGQVVNRAATATSVSSSANPSTQGQAVTFTATVSSSAGTPAGTVQFRIDGSDAGGPITLDASGVATFTTSGLSAGSHTVSADYSGNQNFAPSSGTLSGGQTVQASPTPTPSASPTPGASPTPTPPLVQTLNLSTRGNVQTGENVLISGIIIEGPDASTKRVILRALGPSLTGSQVPATLRDPLLELYDDSGLPLFENDDWRDTQREEIEGTTLQPSNDRESAIVMSLLPGQYTAVMSGADGGTGVGLTEIYDLTRESQATVANISTRGFVGTDNNVLIGGFILDGSGTTDVLIRAIGPSMADDGVANTLADPTLRVTDGNGNVTFNDNWGTDQQAQISATTIPPDDEREAAIFATLPAGTYTAIVAGAEGTTGVALVEIYSLGSGSSTAR